LWSSNKCTLGIWLQFGWDESLQLLGTTKYSRNATEHLKVLWFCFWLLACFW
jgi:hypothetical protein